jgi:hypothetical protein
MKRQEIHIKEKMCINNEFLYLFDCEKNNEQIYNKEKKNKKTEEIYFSINKDEIKNIKEVLDVIDELKK